LRKIKLKVVGDLLLHPNKDLAVALPYRYGNILKTSPEAARPFGLARHCSHLYPRGRRVLPSIFNPAPERTRMDVRTFLAASLAENGAIACLLGRFIIYENLNFATQLKGRLRGFF